MPEPILPKPWYNHQIRVWYRDQRDPLSAVLLDANVVGLLVGVDGDERFITWGVVGGVFYDE